MRPYISTVLFVLVATACIGSSPFAPWGAGQRPEIAQIQPSTAAVGDQVTVTGTGFTPTDNALKIGAGYILHLESTDATSIRVTLPSYLGVCAPGQEVCVALALPMAPGDYELSVINAHGTSHAVAFHVLAK
jgi:hypothetical protein